MYGKEKEFITIEPNIIQIPDDYKVFKRSLTLYPLLYSRKDFPEQD